MKKFQYLNEELLYFLHCHTTIAFKLYNLVLHIDDFFSDGALWMGFLLFLVQVACFWSKAIA